MLLVFFICSSAKLVRSSNRNRVIKVTLKVNCLILKSSSCFIFRWIFIKVIFILNENKSKYDLIREMVLVIRN